jgi:hypothetical protein
MQTEESIDTFIIKYRINPTYNFIKSIDSWKTFFDTFTKTASEKKSDIINFLIEKGHSRGDSVELDVNVLPKNKVGIFWRHHLIFDFES